MADIKSEIKKKILEKMAKIKAKSKLNKNDSERLREYSRLNPETGRPLYRMPEGTYKKVGDRYIKED